MFDISFAELALVFIIALVVLGPERLPKAARSIGHWMGRARAAFNHLKNELDREVVNQEMQEMFREKADSLRKEVEQMNRSLNENLLEQHKAETGSAPQPTAPTAAPPAGQAIEASVETAAAPVTDNVSPATPPLAATTSTGKQDKA